MSSFHYGSSLDKFFEVKYYFDGTMGLGFVEKLTMGWFRSIIISSVVFVNLACNSIIVSIGN